MQQDLGSEGRHYQELQSWKNEWLHSHSLQCTFSYLCKRARSVTSASVDEDRANYSLTTTTTYSHGYVNIVHKHAGKGGHSLA